MHILLCQGTVGTSADICSIKEMQKGEEIKINIIFNLQTCKRRPHKQKRI